MSTTGTAWAKELRVALEAGIAASAVTRAVQASWSSHSAINKADASPVTIADFAAQAVVVRALRGALGDVAVLGEESAAYLRERANLGQCAAALEAARLAWPDATRDEFLEMIDLGSASASRARGDTYWTIDPIDGTKGFIRGHQYCVCIGLVRQGRPVVGVLACPNLSADHARPFEQPDPVGCVYAATEDGPTLHGPCATGATMTALAPRASGDGATPASGLRLIGSYAAAHQNPTTAGAIRSLLQERGTALAPPVKIDSQCKYAVVARGQADVFLRTPRRDGSKDHVWDHAPGALIAARAGCTVTDCLGVALDFARGTTLAGNQGVLVGPTRAHGLVASAARSVLTQS